MKKKRKKLETIKIRLKKGIVISIFCTLVAIYITNSRYVSGHQEAVYSQLKEKYGMVQEDTQVQEQESIQESVADTSSAVEKNFSLTVDMDLRNPSNVTAEDIEKMLSGTKLSGLGNAFVQAEKQHGVNALYLLGLACLESGYGSSSYAQERNNLYGWCAYDSNPDSASKFSSKEESTLHVAKMLKKNYLTEGGPYFNGYSARAIDVRYCTDKAHADKICNIVSNLTKKLD